MLVDENLGKMKADSRNETEKWRQKTFFKEDIAHVKLGMKKSSETLVTKISRLEAVSRVLQRSKFVWEHLLAQHFWGCPSGHGLSSVLET